jgi:hypothetical protein
MDRGYGRNRTAKRQLIGPVAVTRAAIIFAALIALSGTALAADSRMIDLTSPPIPEPPAIPQLQQPKQPAANQQQFAPDQRGTEQSPLVVKTVPEKKAAEDIKREEEKAELDRESVRLTRNLAKYTWLLFLATAALAAGTFALAVVAFFQMREGRKAITAAEDAASAANAAAKSTSALAKAAAEQAGHAEKAIK